MSAEFVTVFRGNTKLFYGLYEVFYHNIIKVFVWQKSYIKFTDQSVK